MVVFCGGGGGGTDVMYMTHVSVDMRQRMQQIQVAEHLGVRLPGPRHLGLNVRLVRRSKNAKNAAFFGLRTSRTLRPRWWGPGV